MLFAVSGKRLQKAGVENTEQNRRDYRQLFYTAPGIGGHISGERSFCDQGFLGAPPSQQQMDVFTMIASVLTG